MAENLCVGYSVDPLFYLLNDRDVYVERTFIRGAFVAPGEVNNISNNEHSNHMAPTVVTDDYRQQLEVFKEDIRRPVTFLVLIMYFCIK